MIDPTQPPTNPQLLAQLLLQAQAQQQMQAMPMQLAGDVIPFPVPAQGGPALPPMPPVMTSSRPPLDFQHRLWQSAPPLRPFGKN